MNAGESCRIHNCFQEAVKEIPIECECEVAACAFHLDKHLKGVRQYAYNFRHDLYCKVDALRNITKKMVIINGKDQDEEIVAAQDEDDEA